MSDLMSMNPAEIPADINEYGEPITPEPDKQPEPEVQPAEVADPNPATPPAEEDASKSQEAATEDASKVESEKKVQTPDENAKFAEQRRQQQLEQRVQQELERLKQEAPEFKMAQTLSQMYGKPVDQIFAELQQAALQKQAQEQGVPVEVLKQIQDTTSRSAQLEQQLNQMRFDSWKNRVDSEATTLQSKYPMLSQDDMNQSQEYLLDTLRNPDFPLERAVFALHGEKIATGLREIAKQEALAEISGRGKSPLPPQGGKPSPTDTLTEQERYAAQAMGVSEEDYLKYKN